MQESGRVTVKTSYACQPERSALTFRRASSFIREREGDAADARMQAFRIVATGSSSEC